MERYERLEKIPLKERLDGFRANPITSAEKLSANGILQRMELLCMQIQSDFCDNVERLENGAKFKVTCEN